MDISNTTVRDSNCLDNASTNRVCVFLSQVKLENLDMKEVVGKTLITPQETNDSECNSRNASTEYSPFASDCESKEILCQEKADSLKNDIQVPTTATTHESEKITLIKEITLESNLKDKDSFVASEPNDENVVLSNEITTNASESDWQGSNLQKEFAKKISESKTVISCPDNDKVIPEYNSPQGDFLSNEQVLETRNNFDVNSADLKIAESHNNFPNPVNKQAIICTVDPVINESRHLELFGFASSNADEDNSSGNSSSNYFQDNVNKSIINRLEKEENVSVNPDTVDHVINESRHMQNIACSSSNAVEGNSSDNSSSNELQDNVDTSIIKRFQEEDNIPVSTDTVLVEVRSDHVLVESSHSQDTACSSSNAKENNSSDTSLSNVFHDRVNKSIINRLEEGENVINLDTADCLIFGEKNVQIIGCTSSPVVDEESKNKVCSENELCETNSASSSEGCEFNAILSNEYFSIKIYVKNAANVVAGHGNIVKITGQDNLQMICDGKMDLSFSDPNILRGFLKNDPKASPKALTRTGSCSGKRYSKIMNQMRHFQDSGLADKLWEYSDALLVGFKDRGEVDLQVVLQIQRGVFFIYSHDLKKASVEIERALALAEQAVNRNLLIGRCYMYMANIFLYEKKYEIALKLLDQSRSLFALYVSGEDKAFMCYLYGCVYMNMAGERETPSADLEAKALAYFQAEILHGQEDLDPQVSAKKRRFSILKQIKIHLRTYSQGSKVFSVSEENTCQAKKLLDLFELDLWPDSSPAAQIHYYAMRSDYFLRMDQPEMAMDILPEAKRIADFVGHRPLLDMINERVDVFSDLESDRKKKNSEIENVSKDVIESIFKMED